MVGCRDGGRRGAGQAVGGFPAGRERLAEGGLEGWEGGVGCYFDITRIMRVERRAEEAQALMRACRFVPLPDMRTVSL